VIGGATRVACVIGDPVAHSRSPRMHNAAYAALGLDWCYVALPVAPGAVATALRGLCALGMAGANVTIPHKEEAAAACDVLSPEAEAAGAVNTVVVEPGGQLHGHLTDGLGMLEALDRDAPVWRGLGATVLGAGGSARAAAAALLASGCPRIEVRARRLEAASALVAALRPAAAGAELHAQTDGRRAIARGLLVHATPVGGLTDLDSLPISADDLREVEVVADLAYRADGAPTPLIRAARARGIAAIDGIELLVAQGALAFSLLTGLAAPVDVMRAAARAG